MNDCGTPRPLPKVRETDSMCIVFMREVANTMKHAHTHLLESEESLLRKMWEESGKLISRSRELSVWTSEMNAEFSFFMPSEFESPTRREAVFCPG